TVHSPQYYSDKLHPLGDLAAGYNSSNAPHIDPDASSPTCGNLPLLIEELYDNRNPCRTACAHARFLY
ncbi:hypothetical protein BaRGS_00031127, partial [Batillaria attramentaria]